MLAKYFLTSIFFISSYFLLLHTTNRATFITFLLNPVLLRNIPQPVSSLPTPLELMALLPLLPDLSVWPVNTCSLSTEHITLTDARFIRQPTTPVLTETATILAPPSIMTAIGIFSFLTCQSCPRWMLWTAFIRSSILDSTLKSLAALVGLSLNT